MADKKFAEGEDVQNTVTPKVATATVSRQKNAQRILASRMQAVEKFGKMTPKMQRGFDRFAANIGSTKE